MCIRDSQETERERSLGLVVVANSATKDGQHNSVLGAPEGSQDDGIQQRLVHLDERTGFHFLLSGGPERRDQRAPADPPRSRSAEGALCSSCRRAVGWPGARSPTRHRFRGRTLTTRALIGGVP